MFREGARLSCFYFGLAEVDDVMRESYVFARPPPLLPSSPLLIVDNPTGATEERFT